MIEGVLPRRPGLRPEGPPSRPAGANQIEMRAVRGEAYGGPKRQALVLSGQTERSKNLNLEKGYVFGPARPIRPARDLAPTPSALLLQHSPFQVMDPSSPSVLKDEALPAAPPYHGCRPR